jgi:glycosyltransferase involved in cell wall biosynthesis
VVAYTEYPSDGRVRFEAEALAEAGYEVHAISVRPQAGASPPTLGGVQLIEVPLEIRRGNKARYVYQYLVFFLLSTAVLVRLHMHRRINFVHVHTLPDFEVFCAAPLRMRGAPVLLDLHEAMPELFAARFNKSRSSLWYHAAVALEQLSGRFATQVIVANDGIKAAIVSRGMPEGRISAIYNVGDAPGEQITPDQLRRQLGLPAGRLIVHAGGIDRERDLETVVRAISLLPPELDAYLVIAGNGDSDYIESLRDLAMKCGASERVLFVGRLSLERAKALMSMSLVGLVSLMQNPLTELAWPTRIVEYASLKKPLLVPNLRFLHGVLGSGARYYKPGDAHSLANELHGLMTASGDAERSVSLAAQICSKFGTQEMRRNLLGVYHHVHL